jgi:hypothetical protein
MWQVEGLRRAEVLGSLVAELPAGGRALFVVAEPADTLDCLLGRNIVPEATQ